jgi:phosphate-selective porin OprO/OprP
MNILLGMTGLLWLATTGAPNQPDDAAPETPSKPLFDGDNEITWRWSNGIRFESADKQIKGKFGGRIQFDGNWFLGTKELKAANIETADGLEFRRARLFVSGDLYEDWFFKAQYDMAGKSSGTTDARPGFKDVYLGRRDVLGSFDLQAGQFTEPFSLDEVTSSNNRTFLERALPNVFAPSRTDGVMLSDMVCESVYWGAGVFRADTDGSGFAQSAGDGNYAVTTRVVFTPLYQDDGEELVHVGAGYSVRDTDGVQFSQRPEAHLGPRLVDTGMLAADDLDIGNIELACVFGAVHAEAEYFMADVGAPTGGMDADLDGAYLQVGYFLTGESRPYKRSEGAFDRVVPNHDFKKGGNGAMEIALRYSTLDLNDGAVVQGGELDDITLGFNWYFNPNMRLMFNYVHGSFERGLTVEEIDAFLVRWQVEG